LGKGKAETIARQGFERIWHFMTASLLFPLAVQVDDYYFPVGFDRTEPNLDDSGLTPDEDAAWQDRKAFVEQILGQELGLNKFTFREFTHKLRDAYQQHPEAWHQRIRPGRIWGAIVEAKERFKVKTAYIFVTNQPPGPGHDSDSVYLFDILQQWFSHQMGNAIALIAVPICETVPAVDQDGLLYEYYKFFNQIGKNEEILISIKGGTYQMQTALRVQAMSSEISKQLFVEPRLSIKKVLAGEYSDCQLTSYWRYMRTQKYQTVKLLLENSWDFNGAIKILEEWKTVLSFFIKHQVIDAKDIAYSSEVISRVIKTLDVGRYCFDLDILAAQSFLNNNSTLRLSTRMNNEVNNYDSVLNLYTQCCIHWQLEKIANFLSRMSSFYEGVLEKLARKLNCYEDFPRFKNRFEKRNYVDSQVRSRNILAEIAAWEDVLNLLKSLDYWCNQRNRLIHSAEGVSKNRMQEIFNQERQNYPDACSPQNILKNMAEILSRNLGIVRDEYRDNFVGDTKKYYIYSEVKEWAIEKLMTDGLR
jgi:hypothetical protein